MKRVKTIMYNGRETRIPSVLELSELCNIYTLHLYIYYIYIYIYIHIYIKIHTHTHTYMRERTGSSWLRIGTGGGH